MPGSFRKWLPFFWGLGTVVLIFLGVLQALAQGVGNAHAGGEAVLGGFGVFAQCALHGGMAQNDHLIGHGALELGH